MSRNSQNAFITLANAGITLTIGYESSYGAPLFVLWEILI